MPTLSAKNDHPNLGVGGQCFGTIQKSVNDLTIVGVVDVRTIDRDGGDATGVYIAENDGFRRETSRSTAWGDVPQPVARGPNP